MDGLFAWVFDVVQDALDGVHVVARCEIAEMDGKAVTLASEILNLFDVRSKFRDAVRIDSDQGPLKSGLRIDDRVARIGRPIRVGFRCRSGRA